MDSIPFTLVDADGAEHAYSVRPHPPGEGEAIMWSLVQLGAEPLGRLASLALRGLQLEQLIQMAQAGDSREDGKPRGMMSVLVENGDSIVEGLKESLDLAKVGADIAKSIGALPMLALSRSILSLTERDGKPLNNKLIYDGAYTRNYGELRRALWEVIKINRFLSL